MELYIFLGPACTPDRLSVNVNLLIESADTYRV